MTNIFSVLFFGLASMLAFTPQSGNAQAFNEALGTGALQSNTTGSYNVALGDYTLPVNTTGTSNTATGAAALFHNTTGNENTASGTTALFYNTSGYSNTANGVRALYQNTEGYYNTASGFRSLFSNHTGVYNTASGVNALWANSTGGGNTASGYLALYSNNGDYNTASGSNVLYSNSTGRYNTASGVDALYSNTTGSYNTAIGDSALSGNTTGSENIAVGDTAGNNLTTGSNNIDIGNQGVAGESNTVRIGTTGTQTAAYMAGIWGGNPGGGLSPVYVNSSGQLGAQASSRRFKKDIAEMDAVSEALLSLKPVTFHYKSDNTGTAQFGLIAEEVAKICPDLVVRDKDGEIYTVRYDAVNAMLLNEFLKEHHKVESQEAMIAQLQSAIERQAATTAQQHEQIQELTGGLQKVSAEIAASRPESQTALNNR
jgi:hypothetical protein